VEEIMPPSSVGLKKSELAREGAVVLFDHFINLFHEKIPSIQIKYGTLDVVQPFYTASFVKSYQNLPAVAMTITSNREQEAGLGRVVIGPTEADGVGVHNITRVHFDVWGKNRLEMEAVANAVMRTIQQYKFDLQGEGILDVKLYRTYDRPYDPNAPRMWYGSTQAPGEIWLKMLEYIVRWDYVWGPVEEVYDIKKMEIYPSVEGTTEIYETDIGLMILGLLDSMYLYRNLSKNIKVIRTGGRY
jgi:hypothetical protein